MAGLSDATPLFLILLVEYYHWTEDLATVETAPLPNIESALYWINEYGDRDKDGFVRVSPGISQRNFQSRLRRIPEIPLSMRMASLGQSPIALVEVQGYVYQKPETKLAPILRLLMKSELADRQIELEAQELKKKFNQLFWMDEVRHYFAICA